MPEIDVDLHWAGSKTCRGDGKLPCGNPEETNSDGRKNNRENSAHEKEISF